VQARGKGILGLGLFGILASVALGSGAIRDLPNSILPGATVTVTITLDPPPGTSVAAAEDQPPTGWTVSNISDSGTFDQSAGKVKWGLFFAPSIPSVLTYDVTVGSWSPCFAGSVSYDGVGTAIGGEACAAVVPTVSTWGAATLLLLLLICGGAIAGRKSRLKVAACFA
jgi:hypothetical protein